MTEFHFVGQLEDLIRPEEYLEDTQGKRVRLRIRSTPQGVEIIGDAIRVRDLEEMLEKLEPEFIERVLCG
uniref:Uncharacterized protein n=1 Tax=Candidatus Kentrum sp. TUN TaxID=2126343 RepID=A0A451AV95_9GAMM|nr:MAG: hypothetical protein BECKTUN1418F_GA0071002_12192 [Candidatus Kentron sp. TUN]VFK60920.1 MAG: hypothetical protein BECKTUN1418D_GA0071000_11392 [Candidatus Kentron sp. TUN]VFK69966.1 MAG: hypothetical protein BECKTUN1418E_GA0071001_12242 [Candidatus Kentron sp. TUN]